MTVYDAAIVGIIVLGMIWGAIRGITWQLASIASLVLGYLVAFPLSGQLTPHFPGSPVVARALALMATYAAVSGGVFLAAWLVRATLRQWKFEAFDRHLGMILGGLEGALLGLLVTVFVVSLAPQTRPAIFASRSGHVVAGVLDAVEPILPAEIRTELAPFWSGGGQEAAPGQAAASSDVLSKAPSEKPDTPEATQSKDAALLEELVKEGASRVDQAIHEASERERESARRSHDGNVERR